MAIVVADTSALVSLGCVVEHPASPLDRLLDSHEVLVPERVIEELHDTAAYDDPAGRSAEAVLDRRSNLSVRLIALDESFPLDAGENAAVTLANDVGSDQLLCDEFTRLALVHASLVDTRLVTTPTLLLALVRADELSVADAETLLSEMSDARSWDANAYVTRARAVLEGDRE